MRLRSSLAVACILCLLSLGAFADDTDKVLKEHFEFNRDVMIGNTLVKKGRYLVKYNTEKGLVKIVDETGDKKVVAVAKATFTTKDESFEKDEILTREESGQVFLTGLRLGGQKEEITLTEAVTTSN